MSEMRILRVIGNVDEIFIAELNEVETKRHINYRLTTLIVIVALISILAMTAYATEHVTALDYWFYNFFSQDTSSSSIDMLTENQQTILEHGLVEINQSVVDNGVTITLESGLSDGYRAYLKFRVDLPEGTALNADGYSFITKTNIKMPDGEDGNFSLSYSSGKLLDENPADSVLYIWKNIFSNRHLEHNSLWQMEPFGI